MSVYLISGFSLNLLDVTTEEDTQFLLKQDLVLFPFGITKATAITLARRNQADRLLWGKILNNAGDATGSVTIKMFLIDVAAQSQRYLPLIKGDSKDFSSSRMNCCARLQKPWGKKTARSNIRPWDCPRRLRKIHQEPAAQRRRKKDGVAFALGRNGTNDPISSTGKWPRPSSTRAISSGQTPF